MFIIIIINNDLGIVQFLKSERNSLAPPLLITTVQINTVTGAKNSPSITLNGS